MPTTTADDQRIDSIYDQIEKLFRNDEIATDQVIIIRDFKAVVGEGREGREIGEFGLGNKNERGQTLVDFCNKTKNGSD